MTPAPLPVRALSTSGEAGLAYSFCTLVTDVDEYRAMVSAFVAKGFGPEDCEYLYADNSAGNRFEAFAAGNRFLQEARGRYIVLCHQDILPLSDDRHRLDERLGTLTARDPDWALCGNAGGTPHGKLVYRLTQGRGPTQTMDDGGPFPTPVMSLDENFIVVRRDANLAFSRDLSGFHWYGADLCIVADILGWRSYVIDFHLHHKSSGTLGAEFRELGANLRRKYAHAFRSRWHHVPTSRPVFLSASSVETFVARTWNAVAWRARDLFKGGR